MPRRFTALLVALVVAVSLTACAADDEPTPTEPASTSTSAVPSGEPEGSPPSETSNDAGPAIAITRRADVFEPNGERIQLDVGQTLAVTITADQAGELHVHSTPEQTIAYDTGTSEHEITIDRPGLVEVENHEPAVVVLQLEVR